MDVDVTYKGIARRIMLRKINDVMNRLVTNNITVYTDTQGNYNDNYWRTRALLVDTFSVKE